MSDESLRKLLAEVHERLQAPGGVDPESQRLLRTLMQDIDATLDRRAPAAAAGATSNSSAPRVEALAVQFEAEHPTIAQLLRQIGALLGQAGI